MIGALVGCDRPTGALANSDIFDPFISGKFDRDRIALLQTEANNLIAIIVNRLDTRIARRNLRDHFAKGRHAQRGEQKTGYAADHGRCPCIAGRCCGGAICRAGST